MIKSNFIVSLSLLTLSFTGFAQQAPSSSAELTCRSQAKEIAVQTYQSCVTTARQKRIEEIRKEYQSKLSELKSHYDSELKKLSPSQAANGAQNKKVATKKKSKDDSYSSTSGLPKKKNENVQTLPVQNVQESSDTAVQVVEDGASQESVNVVEPDSYSE